MGFFDKLKKITSNLFSGFTEADEAFFEELEETLIMADLGVEAATDAVEKLRTKVRKEHLQSQEEVREALREILMAEMEVGNTALKLDTKPSVCIFIGVNGVGKTTSIGKVAASLKKQGKRVLLCAADTFRAAAADQLEIWAERAGCEIVRQYEGADPGAVLFDALQAAKARNVDVVLCDTAGRLHNKANLMAELAKLSKMRPGDAAGAGRHYRPERPDPGPDLQGDGGTDGHRPDQAGRYCQGRHRHRHRPGAGRTCEVRRSGRGHRRSETFRCPLLCGGNYLTA